MYEVVLILWGSTEMPFSMLVPDQVKYKMFSKDTLLYDPQGNIKMGDSLKVIQANFSNLSWVTLVHWT